MPTSSYAHTRPRAVVLLSGGLDSATCLAIAAQDYDCYAISFAYGQRHNSELAAAARLAKAHGAVDHRVISIDLGGIGGSALTDMSIDVPEEASLGIPVTYVPARNTVFLAFALGFAEVVHADTMVIGVNAVDYSGYPDCRPEYIAAFQQLANLATKSGIEGHPLKVETPLLHLSKAEIIQQGIKLGVDYSLTVSCYQADLDGLACGKCDSCRLRREGFIAAGVTDPTRYR
jgi:7-cyano-7-deazaguanine synthase